MWIFSEDSLELFRNVPFPCWVFLSLLCLGAQLSGVSGVHDFTIYRMQQFDLHGTRLGIIVVTNYASILVFMYPFILHLFIHLLTSFHSII